MQVFEISAIDEGQKLDKYLKKVLPEAPSGLLYKMMRKKNITLNRKKVDGHEKLKAGDHIEMFFSEETFSKFSNNSSNTTSVKSKEYLKAYSELSSIQIIYEDKDILFINKPTGVLSQKSAATDLSANEWLIGYLLKNNKLSENDLISFKPSVCNRLDRNTSGLLLCGKSLKGSQFLSKILKERSLHKFYCTYVQGLSVPNGQFEAYLSKNQKTNVVNVYEQSKLDKNEEHIITSVKTEKEYSDYNLSKLEVLLVTGKSHQIRAHLAHLGHPIIGDIKYGGCDVNKLIKGSNTATAQYLHAYRIVLPKIEGYFSYLSEKEYFAPLPNYFLEIEAHICQHGTPEA